MAWRGFKRAEPIVLTTRWRRVIVLAAIVVLLAAGVGGLYLFRQFQAGQAAQQQRAAGLQAYDRGDYAAAVRDLADYLRWQDDDSDAQLHLAHAALRLAHPQMRDLTLALRALNKVRELKPDNRRAAHELLKLNILLQRNQPALDLANDLLKRDARDGVALETKAVALARLNQPQAAMDAVGDCLKVDANRWRPYLLALRLGRQLDEPPAKLLAVATQMQKAHPHDPRFALIQAVGYAAAGDEPHTRQWLLAAAHDAPAQDRAFDMQLVRYLDTAQLYEASMRVLARAAGGKAEQPAAKEDDDLTLFDLRSHEAAKRELVRRLIEHGRFAEVVEQLKTLDSKTLGGGGDTQQLAFKAFALQQLGKDDDAQPILTALAKRSDDAQAKSWAALLDALRAKQPASKMLPLCLDAVKASPKNAYFQALLAGTLTAMDEPERAVTAWQAAEQSRPTWWLPYTRSAQLLRQLHRTEAALRQARAGLTRAPHRIDAAVAWANAQADHLDVDAAPTANAASTQPEPRIALLDFVEQILKAAPGQEQALLLKVQLLAELDRSDGAARTVRAVLETKTSPAAATLLAMADLSTRFKLGLAQACRDRCEALYGLTPAMALRQAGQLAAQGRAADGLKLLEHAAAKTGAISEERSGPSQSLRSGLNNSGGSEGSGGTSGGWALAKAQYLEATHDPGARAAWQALAKRYPHNAHLLQLALRAPSTQGDRKLTAALLDDLGQTIGQDSVQWRIERARWLLAGQPSTDAAAEAQGLLTQVLRDAPDRVEPRVLLAQAETQLNLLPQAIHDLHEAARRQPGNLVIQMTLAKLYQRTHQDRLAALSLAKVTLPTAQAWRERHPSQAAKADVVIARAKMTLGDLSGAAAVLKPYLKSTDRGTTAPEAVMIEAARIMLAQGNTVQAQALLEPTLTRGASWRTAWERFAAVNIADGDTAAKWLHVAQAKIPSGAVDEQVTLAQSWWYLGDRLDQQQARVQGRRIIDQVVQSPKAGPQAWLLRGMMAQRGHQRDTAIASYRKALALRPGYAAAQNNLAMMLLSDPATEDEAMRLAQAAVRAAPTNAQYLDTLAAAQAQARQYQPAVATIKKAISLEPSNPNWQTRLSQIEGRK